MMWGFRKLKVKIMWKNVLKSKMWNGASGRMNLVRVHMTAMEVNPTPVDGMESEKERISKPPRFSISGESGKGITLLDAELFKLMEEFTKLEEELGKLDHPEAWESEHENGRKKMELLARVETLYNEVKSYKFSVHSGQESFLLSHILSRFELQLKKRSLYDPENTDTLGGHIPLNKIPEKSDIFLELNKLRDAYPKISQIQGNLALFWKLNSFPLQADYFRQNDLSKEWENLARDLVPILESGIRNYPLDIEEVASESPQPEAGKFFDVLELLSRFPGDLIRNDGYRARVALSPDTFKGKYVMICCFHVPVIPIYPSEFPFIVSLCNELYATRDDFEMVVVARMNSLADDEEVFQHFFSGFPKSCLAVPFKDSRRRDYICNLLGLVCQRYPDRFECLLVSAEGIVVERVLTHVHNGIFSDYGAEGFPFTDDILYKRDLERKDMIFGKEGNWLERVLRCNDSSPDTVYKVNRAGGPRVEMSISQLSSNLKNKHVGLYLCCGDKIEPILLGMYEKCKEKQLDFEVVVVYIPYLIKAADPKMYQEMMESLLKKNNICDWWCLPFNNSVSVRFWNLSKAFDIRDGSEFWDMLFVVGPDVNHLSIYGLNVMAYHGIGAFPFTVEAGIKLIEKGLRRITLDSVFTDGDVSVFRGNNSSDSKKLSQLFQGKKYIILCIGNLDLFSRHKIFKLASVYNQTKKVEKDDFEMVHVLRPYVAVYDSVDEMPWYICPPNATNFTKLDELIGQSRNIMIGQSHNIMVGFGEDGRVCSCRKTSEVASQQFSLVDTLYHDLEHMMGYDMYDNVDMEAFASPSLGR